VQSKRRYQKTKRFPISLQDCGRRSEEKISEKQVAGVAAQLLDRSMWGRVAQRPSKHLESR
jgi:hypothetical protein